MMPRRPVGTKEEMAAIRDRIRYLLRHKWLNRVREMARDLGVSWSLISAVVNGRQNAGRKLLDALVAHPDIDAQWLCKGIGQPRIGAEKGYLPIAKAVLPGPPESWVNLLTGLYHPIAPTLERSTRYWFAIAAGSALLEVEELALLPGDLFLIETDPMWIDRFELFQDLLCAIRVHDGGDQQFDFGRVTRVGNDFTFRSTTTLRHPPVAIDRTLRRKKTLRDPETGQVIVRRKPSPWAAPVARSSKRPLRGDIVGVVVYQVRPTPSFGMPT